MDQLHDVNNNSPRVQGVFMSEPGEPLLLSHTNNMYDDAAQAVDASLNKKF